MTSARGCNCTFIFRWCWPNAFLRARPSLHFPSSTPLPYPASPQVKAFTGADQLADALKGAELVVIPAGVPRKPGMTRDDLFNINAGIVKSLCEAVAANCPDAVINIIR